MHQSAKQSPHCYINHLIGSNANSIVKKVLNMSSSLHRMMAVLMLTATLFDGMFAASSNVIPSKEEQANLLTDVQEVFEQVKLLVDFEANSTDDSVVQDVNKMVTRAKDKLALLEDLTITKMSCGSNSVCSIEFKQIVEKIANEAMSALDICIKQGFEHITSNSRQLTDTTERATRRGHDLIATLFDCSRKSSLSTLACYRDVIAKDVHPVKTMLMQAMATHKDTHLRAIEIRNTANECVDSLMARYEKNLNNVLSDSMKCA